MAYCIYPDRTADNVDEEEDRQQASSSNRDPAVQLRLPLRFRLAGSPTGTADLQLQLLSLHIGDACEPGQSSRRGRRRRGRLGSAPQLSGQRCRNFSLLASPSVPSCAGWDRKFCNT